MEKAKSEDSIIDNDCSDFGLFIAEMDLDLDLDWIFVMNCKSIIRIICVI